MSYMNGHSRGVEARPASVFTALVGGLLASAAFASALIAASPAAAQVKRAEPVAQTTRETPKALVAIVSLRSQTIEVYDANGQVTRSPISSGQSGYETPRGVFSIIERNVEHYSNLYNDAPMPYMQRITWSGVALHAGALPGYPASHGCIRLPHEFAKKLFSMTHMGTRVIVTGDSPSPIAITHAKLMTPLSVDPKSLAQSQPATDIGIGILGETAQPAPMRVASGEGTTMIDMPQPMRLGVPLGTPKSEPLPSLVPASRGVASGKYLDMARAEAQAGLAAADRALVAARAAHAKVLKDNAAALKATLAAERQLAAAEKRFTAAEEARAKARTESQAVKAEEAALRAEVEIAAARSALDAATPEAGAAAAAKAQADASLKQAETTRVELARTAKDLDRKARPISVFISRKTKRLYIRQGFEPVMDVAVEIQDPTRPLGTHVFTAMTTSYEPATASWHAVTVVEPGQPREDVVVKGKRDQKTAAALTARSGSASAALDRITIPADVSRRIGESLRAGASIVISDEGISNETGKGTDFVVLTR